MDLQTVEVPVQEAREAFLDYRRAVRERHDEEDAQLMRAYREAAKGHRLIRLPDTIRAGGTTQLTFRASRRGLELTRELPRIAVCPAHWTVCWCLGIDSEGDVEFRSTNEWLAHNNRKDRMPVRGVAEALDGRSVDWGTARVRAIVPNVPPPLRPAHHLRNYRILFEAEWAVDPKPPVDPALLKHIGGDLYAVLAVWDLTPIERAVLAARADD